MKRILVLGAGLSASSLLRYLIALVEKRAWELTIGNGDLEALHNTYGSHPQIRLRIVNAAEKQERRAIMEGMDLVISMLPASFHVAVAEDCIALKINLITPSYVSKEMRELDAQAKANGVTIMNETGVDPGIDHMSAMKVIHEIRRRVGVLKSFKSFCGGLIAPESDDNAWHYKFTWNPRNVVLAGQGGVAAFRQNKELKYIPYAQLFKRTERFEIDGFGAFDGYANRDSLKYLEVYGIDEVDTIYRGTLRRPHYCQGWDVLIELGLTDDSYILENSRLLTPRQLLNAFLPYHPKDSVEIKLKKFLRKDREHLYSLFEEIGFFDSSNLLCVEDSSPAFMLQALLQKSWILKETDKDMLVMIHEFEFEIGNKRFKTSASMVVIGEDRTYTAMSNTVGLPIGIIAKRMLDGYKDPGVKLPISEALYMPVLTELEELGITFTEITQEI
ncbi:MAG: saccharopine dehydrogenase family protein [Flavobacteriales bacterium]|jgi:saccharopine dehydrogenase-like NADP-dependent oxidoreductase